MTTTIRKPRTLNLTAPEVRAMLAGRKLAHVLPVKPQPTEIPLVCGIKHTPAGTMLEWQRGREIWDLYLDAERCCPIGQPGDVVLCRETYNIFEDRNGSHQDSTWAAVIRYKADDSTHHEQGMNEDWRESYVIKGGPGWLSSATMPAWAVRLRPIIESVSVKRTSEISEAEVEATGAELTPVPGCGTDNKWCHGTCARHGRCMYIRCRLEHAKELWDTRYAKRGLSWKSNPWVWLVKWRLPTC